MPALLIKLDPDTAKRFDRAMDYLEGKEQKRVDALVEELKASRTSLSSAVESNKQEGV